MNQNRDEVEADAPPSFEQAFGGLEEIVRQLESSQLGLTQALELYERGIRNLKICHQALADAERRIELLTGVDDDGSARTEPFDESDLPAEEKVGRRTTRRASVKKVAETESIEGDQETMDDGSTLF